MGGLAGATVVVTRPRDQSAELVALLRDRGATPILAPAIEIVPSRSSALTRALDDLRAGGFEWLTLTSRATVDVLRRRMRPGEVRASVAAVGEGTSESFAGWANRRPDLVPRTFTTEALARAFPRGHGRVLCPRADVAPDGLEEALEAKGWSPLRVEAYRTRLARVLPRDARAALEEGRVQAITFTSASTVRGFVGAAPTVPGTPKIVCIGPVTAREARGHGFVVAAVARPHTIEGVVAALERALAPRPRSSSRGGARRPGA